MLPPSPNAVDEQAPSSCSAPATNSSMKISNHCSGVSDRCAALISLAYEVTSESWSELGTKSASEDIDGITERIVALLLVRIVAIVTSKKSTLSSSLSYSDLSTTTICRTAMKENHAEESWHTFITEDILQSLRDYVKTICEGYRCNAYHNVEHAYHVVISANKLLDMMLCDYDEDDPCMFRPSYGIRADPLSQMALIYSALVHDVDHQGVPNRQLVYEFDSLAIQYNDQSVAEQRSLAVAFSVWMKPEFEALRNLIFPERDEYARFRKIVINLVLTTDIASPERLQILKSKWNEAFGPTSETKERKARAVMKRNSMNNLAQTSKGEDIVAVGEQEFVPGPKNPAQQNSLGPSILRRSTIGSADPHLVGAQLKDKNVASFRRITVAGCTPKEITNIRGDWQNQPPPKEVSDPKSHTLLSKFFQDQKSAREVGSRLVINDDDSTYSLSPSVSVSGSDDGLSDLRSEAVSAVATMKKKINVKDNGNWNNDGEKIKDNGEVEGIKTFDNSIDLHRDITMDFSAWGGNGSEGNIDDEDNENGGNPANLKGTAVPKEVVDVKGLASLGAGFDNLGRRKNSGSDIDNDSGHNSVTKEAAAGTPFSSLEEMLKGAKSESKSSGCDDSNASSRSKDIEAETEQKGVKCTQKTKPTMPKGKGRNRHPPYVADRRFKMSRVLSVPAIPRRKNYDFRLGIRRALDFAGNAVEAFQNNESFKKRLSHKFEKIDFDEPNELRASVVLEQLMKAADVAALLQGFGNIKKWSSRLWVELKTSHVAGRGDDPTPNWYDGQIVFLDCYALPLAKRLADTGVFPKDIELLFEENVKNNRSIWLDDGEEITDKLINDWETGQSNGA